MALERNNTTLEFETMLRRHLARGGAIVAACAGFDADAASAYLEGVLDSAAQTAYEAHLADCPACRRHFIEISRLVYSLTPTAPVTTPGLWDRLQNKLADWFEPAEWNWHWAPAAAAAGALVLAVLAAQLWQQPSSSIGDRAGSAQIAAHANQAPTVAPTQAIVEIADQAVPSATSTITATDNLATLRRDVPRPPVEAQPMNESLTALNLPPPAPERAADFSNAVPQAPLELRGGASAQTEALPALPSPSLSAGFTSLAVSDRNISDIEAPAGPTVALDQATPPPVVAARLSPPAEENPARLSKVNRQPVNPTLRSRMSSFMPFSKAEPERKTTSEEAGADVPRSMTIRINDKVFRFVQGVWEDQAYKDEMRWRVLKLVRGSREYDQVLAAEPQLKEFFARGPIVIVWKDKIYKVVGQ